MANLAPPLWQRFLTANGEPASGWKLQSFVAGTSTPIATYTDESALTPNTNPVVLDSDGYADVWLEPGSYKFILMDQNDVVIRTVDNVTASSGGGSSVAVGGTTGQAYTKLSDANFHAGWTTIDKTFVGLGNVDNTSDADKPVSTATQTALNGKEPTIAAGSDGQVWTIVGGVKTWANPSGGGSGGLGEWIPGNESPIETIENGFRVHKFQLLMSQTIQNTYDVPASYQAGQRLMMRMLSFSPDSSGTNLLYVRVTLYKPGTTAATSTTNQHISGNTAITLALANRFEAHVMDLCALGGTINGQAIAANDVLKIELLRDNSDTGAEDIRALAYTARVYVA